MAYTPKPYTLLETREDGTELRQYENGDIRDQKGRVVVPNDTFRDTQITSENSRSLHAMRKAKILRAIEERVQDVTRTNAPAEAIGAIVGKRAQIAMTDDTRTGNEAAKIVLQALDAYQDRADKSHETTIRNEYALDPNTLDALMRIVERRRTEYIEATAIRTEDEQNTQENMGNEA